jgi:hypothetical protein
MMRSILFVGALAASIACATAGSTPGGRHDPNVISEQEVASSNASNAYDVIITARPSFLKTRGHSTITLPGSDYATVYVNSQQYGDVTSLRTIAVDQIKEIRYFSASEAVTKFGSQSGSGVIQIITK